MSGEGSRMKGLGVLRSRVWGVSGVGLHVLILVI